MRIRNQWGLWAAKTHDVDLVLISTNKETDLKQDEKRSHQKMVESGDFSIFQV